jgi:hypothetical protein
MLSRTARFAGTKNFSYSNPDPYLLSISMVRYVLLERLYHILNPDPDFAGTKISPI